MTPTLLLKEITLFWVNGGASTTNTVSLHLTSDVLYLVEQGLLTVQSYSVDSQTIGANVTPTRTALEMVLGEMLGRVG